MVDEMSSRRKMLPITSSQFHQLLVHRSPFTPEIPFRNQLICFSLQINLIQTNPCYHHSFQATQKIVNKNHLKRRHVLCVRFFFGGARVNEPDKRENKNIEILKYRIKLDGRQSVLSTLSERGRPISWAPPRIMEKYKNKIQ